MGYEYVDVDVDRAGIARRAAKGIVAEMNAPATVDEGPGSAPRVSVMPEALMNARPSAYRVTVSPAFARCCVSWRGRFGFGGDVQIMDYPCAVTDPDFAEKFAELLRPAILRALEQARVRQCEDLAEYGPFAPYEMRDAIRELTPEQD